MEISGYRGFGERLRNLQIGDTVFFGNYDLPTGSKPCEPDVRMPITWKVIKKNGSMLKLFSVYSLDWEGFEFRLGGAVDKANWRDSFIRKYLNETLYNRFFSEHERKSIVEVEIETFGNPKADSCEKECTRDKLFLPSYEELSEIQPDMMTGIIPMTDGFDEEITEISFDYQDWWLRTPGTSDINIMCVDRDGTPDIEGLECYCEEIGIRPMMWIDADML